MKSDKSVVGKIFAEELSIIVNSNIPYNKLVDIVIDGMQNVKLPNSEIGSILKQGAEQDKIVNSIDKSSLNSLHIMIAFEMTFLRLLKQYGINRASKMFIKWKSKFHTPSSV